MSRPEQEQVPLPPVPTQTGPHGIRYDFNEGCRVMVPQGSWRVRLRDLDSDTTLFDAEFGGGLVTSSKKYYVRFGIDVWKDGESVFHHDFDAAGRTVLARMELGGLGDQIAWIGHAVAFAERHGARLTCAVRATVIPLFQPAYPEVALLSPDQVEAHTFYATYKLFVFYADHDLSWQPCDYRQVGLVRIAAYILGLHPHERRPRIAVDPGGPPIPEPYVCIGVQATGLNKYWTNQTGWGELVAFLKTAGYRVVCIDRERVHGRDLTWIHIPNGVEDQTGERPLAERARWLRHAAFFAGLSSGLSWLAWAAGCPVVMISGFTHPLNEFHTDYRVINYHACNSCSNDVRCQLDPTDFFWCPRLSGTDRMFECTRAITAEQVKRVIRTIPGFPPARPDRLEAARS